MKKQAIVSAYRLFTFFCQSNNILCPRKIGIIITSGTVFVGVTESIARACYATCSAKVVGCGGEGGITVEVVFLL